jgi:hypothetical protein
MQIQILLAKYMGRTEDLLGLMENCTGESLEEGENDGAELALLQQGSEQAGKQGGSRFHLTRRTE